MNKSRVSSAQLRQRTTAAALAAALSIGIATPALAARPLGVDVSDNNGTVTWSGVKSSGITFAWAKATEDTTFVDSDFTANMNNGKAAGIYMGAYHFAHPYADTPASEASHFWSVAGSYIKADGKSFQPMLDMEEFSGIVGASSYSDWANKWCSAIVADASAAGVKVKPAIYTSACSGCNFDSSIAQWFADIADYSGEAAQTGTPWSTCTSCEAWGTGVWQVWQYGDCGSISGVSGCCDVDVFNGTPAGLVASMVPVSTSSGTSAGKIIRRDFNGDGRDDWALFRPSDGTWHIRFSSDNSDHSFQFGQNGDIPLLDGDFSGDGAADAVVFRPSNATWYVRFSEAGEVHSFAFGTSNDIPLLGGDFDGDGQPDAVVYRPSTSVWYVRFSGSEQIHSFSFGQSGDIPLINGDYDGDGQPDAVIFRPSTGMWYVRFSSTAVVHSFSFGQSGDMPMWGVDYDGDGNQDATVFRPSNGTWYVRFSSNAAVHSFAYGASGDLPWQSYTTADHSSNENLFRPSTATEYTRDDATGNFTSFAYGLSTDIPVR